MSGLTVGPREFTSAGDPTRSSPWRFNVRKTKEVCGSISDNISGPEWAEITRLDRRVTEALDKLKATAEQALTTDGLHRPSRHNGKSRGLR